MAATLLTGQRRSSMRKRSRAPPLESPVQVEMRTPACQRLRTPRPTLRPTVGGTLTQLRYGVTRTQQLEHSPSLHRHRLRRLREFGANQRLGERDLLRLFGLGGAARQRQGQASRPQRSRSVALRVPTAVM